MASFTTPLSFGSAQRAAAHGRWLIEALLFAAAIAALFPAFERLASNDAGRDRRFADAVVEVQGLPAPLLPALCEAHGALAESLVRERLCPRPQSLRGGERIVRMPASVASAWVTLRRAFHAPLVDAQARIGALRTQQREGSGDLRALGHAIESIEADIEPFAARFALEDDGEAPRPLACAFQHTQAAIAEAGANPRHVDDVAIANAVLLLGGAIDGHARTTAAATNATLPKPGPATAPHCASGDLTESLAAASAMMAEARAAPLVRAKNDAMRSLLRTAGVQWAACSLAGLVLLHLARSGIPPLRGLSFALAGWAGLAWLFRVPWPFPTERGLVLGRTSEAAISPPADFVVALLVAAAALAIASIVGRERVARPAPSASSVVAYPGLVLATGIGWLVLLDLSANAHHGNRYLALYHQGHLWLGMLAFTAVAFGRPALGRAFAWTLSVAGAAASRIARTIGAGATALMALAFALALAALVAALLSNTRQLTSELGRLWLVGGAAWFFFLRGTPLTERLARRGATLASLVRYVAPLLFVVVVLVAAMVFTRDMGPLLIAGYGAGAFVAASVAMWLHQRTGAAMTASALAVVVFAAWIALTTAALFRFGTIDRVTAGRLENTAAPLASANDQLALVTWFQRAAPEWGFGSGAVPWCGFRASGACAGVPAQIQSDYTFTALVGVFGWVPAWMITLACVFWLYAIVRGHAHATRGEPRMVRSSGRIAIDDQAFTSWLCLAFVVLALCQLAVTVAGNLAVIPLTGVTFPFVSFGMTSLVVNMAMLGLAANVTTKGPIGDG